MIAGLVGLVVCPLVLPFVRNRPADVRKKLRRRIKRVCANCARASAIELPN